MRERGDRTALYAVGLGAVRTAARAAGATRCSTLHRRPGPGGAAARGGAAAGGQPAPGRRPGADGRRSCARCPGRACAPTCATGARRSGCPTGAADRVVCSASASADEDYLREHSAPGAAWSLALPHMGNWDHAGAWAVAHRGAVHDRRRAAAAGAALRPVPRLPRGPGHGGPAADRRRAGPLDVLAQRLRAGRLVPCWPTATCAPAASRSTLLRRADPDAGGAGDARAAHRRGAAPGEHLARRGGAGAAAGHPLPRRGAPPEPARPARRSPP